MKKIIILILIIIMNINGNYINPLLGSRALGIGGAYTAIADDAYAIFWNPAGLGLFNEKEIKTKIMYTDIYNSGVKEYSLLAGTKYNRYGIGLGLYRIGLSDVYNENTLISSYSYELIRNSMIIGLNIKFYNTSVPYYNLSISKLSFDISSLYAFSSKIRIGVIVKDIHNPKFKLIQSTEQEDIINREIRLGLMYKPEKFCILSFELSRQESKNHIFFGAELLFEDVFYIRGGLKDFEPNLGIGFAFNNFGFDIAFSQNYYLGLKTRVDLEYKFSYN